MAKFKVGDRVIRVNEDNGDQAQVGTEAVVVAVDPHDGDPIVRYEGMEEDEGWANDGPSEMWFSENTELLTASQIGLTR